MFQTDETGKSGRKNAPRKVAPKKSFTRFLPFLAAGLVVAAGAAYYVHSARFLSSSQALSLPPGLTTEHPGDLNWYQEFDGVYHHWIVRPDGNFEYVGPMEGSTDAELHSGSSEKSMAEQRRRALMNALTR